MIGLPPGPPEMMRLCGLEESSVVAQKPIARLPRNLSRKPGISGGAWVARTSPSSGRSRSPVDVDHYHSPNRDIRQVTLRRWHSEACNLFLDLLFLPSEFLSHSRDGIDDRYHFTWMEQRVPAHGDRKAYDIALKSIRWMVVVVRPGKIGRHFTRSNDRPILARTRGRPVERFAEIRCSPVAFSQMAQVPFVGQRSDRRGMR